MKKIVSYIVIFTLLFVTVTAVQQGHPFNEIWQDGSGGFNFTRYVAVEGRAGSFVNTNITGVNWLNSIGIYTNMFQMPIGHDEGKVLVSNAEGVGTWQDISGLNGTSKWEINETTDDIYRLDNKVGIGTSDPKAKLHVDGSQFVLGGSGDVNLDGNVNVLDALNIKQYLFQNLSLTAEQFAEADILGRGFISPFDASLLGKHIIGIVDLNDIEQRIFAKSFYGRTIWPILTDTGHPFNFSKVEFGIGYMPGEKAAIRINHLGDVGIGTDSPDYKLHVNGTVKADIFNGTKFCIGDDCIEEWSAGGSGESLWNQSDDDIYYNQGKVGIGTTDPQVNLDVRGNYNKGVTPRVLDWISQVASKDSTNPLALRFGTSNSLTLHQRYVVIGGFEGDNIRDLVLQPTGGNVGIGTDSPDAKLDVNGQIKIRGGSPGDGKVLTSDDDGLASWQSVEGGISGSGVATRLAFWNGTSSITSSSNLYWDNNNNRLGIGTADPQEALDVSGSIRLSGEGIKTIGGSGYFPYIEFHPSPGAPAGGDLILRGGGGGGPGNIILGTGALEFVGIGTDSPDAKLDVNGQIKIRGGSPGEGKVLTSDADGLASWQSVEGGISGSGVATRLAFWNGTSSITSSSNLYWHDSTNRLGIGTDSPDAKLDVNGQIKIRGGSPGEGKVLTSDANGLATWEGLPASDNYDNWIISADGTDDSATVGSGDDVEFIGGVGLDASRSGRDITFAIDAPTCGENQYSYWDGSAWKCRAYEIGGEGNVSGKGFQHGGQRSQIAFWTGNSLINGDDDFIWDNNNKRLGIGTTSPDAQLHISKQEQGFSSLHIQEGTSGNSKLIIRSPNEPYDFGGGGIPFSSPGRIYTSYERLALSAGGITNQLILGTNGNVGIGINFPSQKLHVNGKIRMTGTINHTDQDSIVATKGYVDNYFSSQTPTIQITPPAAKEGMPTPVSGHRINVRADSISTNHLKLQSVTSSKIAQHALSAQHIYSPTGQCPTHGATITYNLNKGRVEWNSTSEDACETLVAFIGGNLISDGYFNKAFPLDSCKNGEKFKVTGVTCSGAPCIETWKITPEVGSSYTFQNNIGAGTLYDDNRTHSFAASPLTQVYSNLYDNDFEVEYSIENIVSGEKITKQISRDKISTNNCGPSIVDTYDDLYNDLNYYIVCEVCTYSIVIDGLMVDSGVVYGSANIYVNLNIYLDFPDGDDEFEGGFDPGESLIIQITATNIMPPGLEDISTTISGTINEEGYTSSYDGLIPIDR